MALLFLNKYRELIKTAGKRIKKCAFRLQADCPDIRKEMKHLKNINQCACLCFCGGPVGRQSYYGMLLIIFFPESVFNFFSQLLQFVVFHDYKYLIRRRAKTQTISFFLKSRPYVCGCLDGRFTNSHIKIIPEQFIELDSQQSSLCEKSSMLLDDCEQMGDFFRVRNYHRLAKKRAALRASDIKSIAQRCQIRQAHIILRTGQGIRKSCPIHIQINPILITYISESLQFCFCIKRSILCRMGQINHSGHYHMFMVLVTVEIFKIFFHIYGRYLSVLMRDCKNFMPVCFDGARFVDTVDVTANQKYIYYKVRAIDYSTNEGFYSPVLQVIRPSLMPPAVAHIDSTWVDDDGIHMRWITSAEHFVSHHLVWRRLHTDKEWTLLRVCNADSLADYDYELTLLDKPEYTREARYDYAIESVNYSGVSSEKSLAYSVRWEGDAVFALPLKLYGEYLSDKEETRLVWEMPQQPPYKGRWYFCIFRQGPDDDAPRFLISAAKEDRAFSDHLLEPGQQASYFIRVKYADGRQSEDSNTVTVKRPTSTSSQ